MTCGTLGAGGGNGTPGSATWINQILTTHNQVRACAMPTPMPAMADLTWDTTIVTTAQAWANNCTWAHNAGRGSLGENIYASTANPSPVSVVSNWASEAQYYNFASNTCATGQVCGHYTQIVWRNTLRLGCAQATCTTGSPFGNGTWYFVVCDYAPPGNYTGQRPY